jgi:5-methylcytosine-specific restriction endonuclease McrA
MAGKSMKGGAKNGAISIAMFFVLIGVLLAWARVNNINSLETARDYFKAWSDKTNEKIDECKFGELKWECRPGENPNNPYSPPKPGSPTKPGGNDGISWSPGGPDSPGGEMTPPGGTTGDLTLSADAKKFTQELGTIQVKAPSVVNYTRGEWRHWNGSPCNTRADVLVRDGANVKVNKTKSSCSIVSGEWISPYDNKTLKNSIELDIDHVIPLSYAARHGGQAWPATKKTEFANDMSNLIAVTASENRKKSDKGPAEYMPPSKEFHCSYSKVWISTAKKYSLSITAKDKTALQEGLKQC